LNDAAFNSPCDVAHDDVDRAARRVRMIVEEGNLRVHQLSGSMFALERILSSVKHRDEALAIARWRHYEYREAAASIELPHYALLCFKVVLQLRNARVAAVSHARVPVEFER
jgi:hypothetical protein